MGRTKTNANKGSKPEIKKQPVKVSPSKPDKQPSQQVAVVQMSNKQLKALMDHSTAKALIAHKSTNPFGAGKQQAKPPVKQPVNPKPQPPQHQQAMSAGRGGPPSKPGILQGPLRNPGHSGHFDSVKEELEYYRNLHAKHGHPKKEKAWYENLADLACEWLPKIAPMVLTGLGDYEVKTNSITAAASALEGEPIEGGMKPPVLSNSKSHNIIAHREYLGDVLSTTDNFQIQYFSINPGLFATFPWLAPLANSYQAYRLRGMVFEFNSLATDYAATPNIGFVAMSTQYDSHDPEFGSKLQMLNNEYTSSRKTSESFMHPIECAPDQTGRTQLYVRNGKIGSDADQNLYDWGQFALCVGGQPSDGAVIGELWCSYEVEFYKPKLGGDYDQLVGAITSTNYTNSTPLGTNAQASGPLPITFDTGTIINFPTLLEGTYVLVITWQASTAVAWQLPGVVGNHCTITGSYIAPPEWCDD